MRSRRFEDFRREFAVRVASDYFGLLANQQSIANRKANLVTLQQLTARSQALYANGRANYIDVQRALQEQLQAENQLVASQAGYQSSLDDFKLLLGMPVDQPLDVVAAGAGGQHPGHDRAGGRRRRVALSAGPQDRRGPDRGRVARGGGGEERAAAGPQRHRERRGAQRRRHAGART
jgi:hypothetical protein